MTIEKVVRLWNELKEKRRRRREQLAELLAGPPPAAIMRELAGHWTPQPGRYPKK